MITLNITAIVQNWANGDANLGVLIWSNSQDGVQYRSSESTEADGRVPPTLAGRLKGPER